ncbi:MAG: DUF305 domain-containing protein [Nocardioides sp.]
MTRKLYVLMSLFTALFVLTACGGGAEVDEAANETRTAPNGDRFNEADVAFATDMIPHHAQALSMVDLTLERDLDPEVQALAEDIRDAQAPEIEQMTDWLTAWDEPVPETMRDHSNAEGGGGMEMDFDMPGMMSEDEMSALGAAPDEEFQQLFLEMMTEHHEGAIEMAQTEQSDGEFTPAIDLAETIESGQQSEVDVMKDLLGS